MLRYGGLWRLTLAGLAVAQSWGLFLVNPSNLPSITIILVNYNGREHLSPCLDSILALDYPKELVHTICVENDSRDGSRELLASTYPWVETLAQSTNLGFSPAVNLAAKHATSDCVALVNNDMRLDPQWLRGLVSQYDPRAGFICVAGTILDWDGTHVDFVDGTINFHGFGQQQGFGLTVEEAAAKGLIGDAADGRVLPFACGGSMLVRRDVFVELGGFDPAYFAYFEDVDFGWRLQVCGYRTRLAAHARSYHRHHGTSSGFATHERILLLERNALRTLLKNAGDEALPKLLSAALLLCARRARGDARSDRASYEVGTKADEMESVHRIATGRMHAVNDVLDDLDGILALRHQIQSRRQVSDETVFASFGKPLEALGNDQPPYIATLDKVARFLGIPELFEQTPVSRFVVLSSSDVIGPRMAGTAIRSWELACALSKFVPTTLASPSPVGRSHPDVTVVQFSDSAELLNLVDHADALLVFGFDLRRYPFLAHTRALVVVDLYDPWIFGSLEQYDAMTREQAEGSKAHEIGTLNELMDVGDFFVCASERQRDFWVGMLASRGRLDKVAHGHDPHLRKLIDVVPFGCPDLPTSMPPTPVLRGGKFPGIGVDDKVILWGGGTWDWFDPLGLLEAFVRVLADVPAARLFFMGLELEGRGVPEMAVTRALKARAEELGLVASGHVVFGPWVPYDERGWYLAEAHVGVVAAKAMAESRLAWRTRMLDHFWVGLPTITTEGDVLSDLVHDSGAGIRIPANDVDAMTAALLRVLTDDGFRASCSTAALGLADRFRWSSVVGPLAGLAADPGSWRAARTDRGRLVGGGSLAGGGASNVEVQRLSSELAETQKHLGAARRKLDILNKTPIYPAYRALAGLRDKVRKGTKS
jgi:GT2 family glycosyltransferase/glycosyltransferase involved in cell wall biosynthesis